MARIFSYFLGLVLFGVPAGLAIYHYVIKKQTASQEENCDFKETSESMTESCRKTCQKNNK